VSQLTPYVGNTLTAKSFVIAILGGLDKPLGVIGGGLALGIAEALTAVYLDPTYTNVISFGLLVVVLVTRPSQLFERA
jgi:branched-chain amino acid transport system permease protein